jgi:hypothetical protein
LIKAAVDAAGPYCWVQFQSLFWRKDHAVGGHDRESVGTHRVYARERFADFFLPGLFPLLRSRAACLRVFFDALPFFGAGDFTPARRALDKPIAIAYLLEDSIQRLRRLKSGLHPEVRIHILMELLRRATVLFGTANPVSNQTR